MSPEAIKARAVAFNSDPTRAERHYQDLQGKDRFAFINAVNALRDADERKGLVSASKAAAILDAGYGRTPWKRDELRRDFWQDQAQSAGKAPL